MMRSLAFGALAVTLLFVAAPQTYAAVTLPAIVQCGNNVQSYEEGGQVCTKGECTACDIAKTAKNIMDFMVAAITIVAVLLFVNAGVLYVMSAANPAGVAKAHRLFTSTLIGFIIVLAAYLLIDTFMSFTYGKAWGPWNGLLCDSASDVHCVAKPQQISVVIYPEPHAAGPAYAPSDLQYDPNLKTFVLSDQAYIRGAAALSDPSRCNVNGQSCYDYIAAQAVANGVDPNFAIAIATIESAGQTGVISSSGAVGLMQVMPATGRTLCGSECAGMSDAQMTTWLQDPANNVRVGVQYLQQGMNDPRVQELSGGDTAKVLTYTAARYNGGPNALNASTTCPGQTWFECQANSGYAQTRGYVTKMSQELNKT